MGFINLPIVSTYDDKGIRQAQASIGGFQAVALGAFARIGAFAVEALGQAARAAGRFAVDSVKAASDFEEATAAVGEVFGEASKDIEAFAKSAAKNLGQSSTQALEGAKTFGIFAKAAGLSGQGAADFSKQMLTLATDLASFNNTTVDEAITALGAGLRGENEPLRRFGVLLDDATLKAKAMEMGIYDGSGALTAQQKVLAAQQSILQQTSTQQGDFARTQDGMANSIRTLQATFENFKITVGENLLPAVTPAIQMLADQLAKLAEDPAFIKLTRDFGDALIELTPTLIDLIPHLVEIAMELLPALADILIAVAPLIVALAPIIADLAEMIILLIDPTLQFLALELDMISSFKDLIATGGSFEDWVKRVLNKLGELTGMASATADVIWNMVSAVTRLLGINIGGWRSTIANLSAQAQRLAGSTSGMSGSQYAGRKALGGSIGGNGWSWVGENGPELAKFPVGTHITPAHKTGDVMAGGGGSTYNINISTLKADATIGEVIVNSIKKYERTSGAVFASA